MSYEDYLKQNPDFTKHQASSMKYTYAICKNGFDKPATKQMGSFMMEVAIFIVLLVLGWLFLGAIGIVGAFVVAICISIVRSFSRKQVCPHCKSENFIKNR